MKKFITLSMILLFAIFSNAQSNYESDWKKVTENENKGLPKSALILVENIYNQAKVSNNSVQIIKCVLFKSKYALTLEEDAKLTIVNQIKTEIALANTPEKNMLQSILANLYLQYFQTNRYKFYNRTNTKEKVDKTDFRTWDLHTIFEEIHSLHQSALQNALLLQQSNLSRFNAVLHVQKGSQKIRPTVYDFIAHRALSFYKTGESNLAQPNYKFEIDNPNFLEKNEVFTRTIFTSKDTLSQKLEALNIYKNLTLFHKNDSDKAALVDLTLNRLDFVRLNAKFNEVQKVYLTTLKQLQAQYRNDEISTKIDYRIAKFYQLEAQKYQANKKAGFQFKNNEALRACEVAITKFPNSNGGKLCQNLKMEITATSINLKNEKYVETNKESRLLLNYKNTKKLFFTIYKAMDSENELNRVYDKKKLITHINQLEKVLSFNQNLKTEKDYQLHNTEIIVPKLKQGSYIIVASSSKELNIETDFAHSFIEVTNIALIELYNNKEQTYQVVNRFTGKPLKGAKLHFKNTNTNNYNKPFDKTFTADENGFVKISTNNQHNRIVIFVSHNEDKGVFKYYRISKPYNNRPQNPQANKQVFLFTDRSIYRPSQIVYFKGIAVKQERNKSTVITNQKVVVQLKDANYQNVKELELTTNEFGSFAGEFILPNNGLTGNFQLVIDNDFRNEIKNRVYGNVSFSVEEYKRPKFSAKFDKITDTFKLNDNITVKGKAIAYAGANISNAKVVYRVKRNVRYPKWWYWYRPYQPTTEAQEITHGETKTDDKGTFEIAFKAMPDTAIKQKDLPVFSYEITADIIDINGETRSTTTIVKVGYHAQIITINTDNRFDKSNKENKLTITTKNLNGEVIDAKGTLKIYKIKAPKNVYRIRPWKTPDYPSLSKTEFERLFPHEVYETLKENDQKGALVYQTTFDTSKNKELLLAKMKSWNSGSYIAIAESTDKFNQPVIDKANFTVYSDKDKKVPDNQLIDITLNKDKYAVGDKVSLKIGSASKDITVIVTIEKDNTVIDTQLIHLNDEIKYICIPVNKEDVGGFAITYHLVNYNSFIGGNLAVNVPYPSMDLEIETLTFRDKLQPGAEETWRFKVKGNKKDKVVAEFLTSMYDTSLDQFKKHQWRFNPINKQHYYSNTYANARNNFGVNQFSLHQKNKNYLSITNQLYDNLNWFGLSFGYNSLPYNAEPMIAMESDAVMIKGSPNRRNRKFKSAPVAASLEGKVDGLSVDKAENYDAGYENANTAEKPVKNSADSDFSSVQLRTNFNETAFFFPQLKTDKDGNVSFSFTTPESLTKWKLQVLAHTKDLKSTVKTLETVTQKELMVIPNPPRFLREGDEIVISSKIANLTNKKLSGNAQLQLFDAITNKKIDVALGNNSQTKSFTVDANGNTNVSWTLHIPENIQTVQYKIVAKAGDFSDGEQNVLPVLSNRMLVTETMPMWVRSNQTKTFSLAKLKNNTSTSLSNHKLTLEVTSNPAWYAVQALPYLMEYPYECAEQTFSRYYANTLASHIANSNPRIQQVFNQWKNSDALLSNLEKNQELKSLIIQETPWLRDAQSETEQKKRIALLFDLNKMKNEQENAINKLQQMQMTSGGFPWFKGSRYENRYITQHIAAGFGHLDKLGVFNKSKNESQDMLKKAIAYLDAQILKDYKHLLENAQKSFANTVNKEQKIAEYLKKNHTNHFQVHYLYMRSFYKKMSINPDLRVAYEYYRNQSFTYWQDYNLYSKGLIALVANRTDNSNKANTILASLKENSITSDELGMYWKQNTSSYYWYQAPIETQALMVEVFSEIGTITEDVDNLKIWLLKNKQTNRWKTTKATTEAVYALLLQGTDWISTTEFVDITIGDNNIKPLALEDSKVEAGTGYYKTSWNKGEITPNMANVSIKKEGDGIAWGALYWQYFEDLDKITFAETPLKLSKKLFLKTNEDRGEQISLITDKTKLVLGDLVRVRIELKVDRAMEFVHMKDMRAAGFEPVNVISSYKWQDGLGYYQSTKDASTNFFFDRLPKGVYVFEYDLRVNNIGDFSNGITTIQSMYAPEFTSHSEGVRVKVTAE